MTGLGWSCLILASIGFVVWCLMARALGNRWGYAIAPITYLLNVIAFYAAKIYYDIPPLTLNNWSNIIRLHSLILFISVGVILLTIGRELWIQRKT
jgi:hypothetical protein